MSQPIRVTIPVELPFTTAPRRSTKAGETSNRNSRSPCPVSVNLLPFSNPSDRLPGGEIGDLESCPTLFSNYTSFSVITRICRSTLPSQLSDLESRSPMVQINCGRIDDRKRRLVIDSRSSAPYLNYELQSSYY